MLFFVYLSKPKLSVAPVTVLRGLSSILCCCCWWIQPALFAGTGHLLDWLVIAFNLCDLLKYCPSTEINRLPNPLSSLESKGLFPGGSGRSIWGIAGSEGMWLKNSFICFMRSANLASITIVLRLIESTLLKDLLPSMVGMLSKLLQWVF